MDTHLGVVECVDQEWDEFWEVGFDGFDASLCHGAQCQYAALALDPVLAPQAVSQVGHENLQQVGSESAPGQRDPDW